MHFRKRRLSGAVLGIPPRNPDPPHFYVYLGPPAYYKIFSNFMQKNIVYPGITPSSAGQKVNVVRIVPTNIGSLLLKLLASKMAIAVASIPILSLTGKW